MTPEQHQDLLNVLNNVRFATEQSNDLLRVTNTLLAVLFVFLLTLVVLVTAHVLKR